MSSLFNGSVRAYGDAPSFYDLIIELDSRHKEIMKTRLYYKVYVHCPVASHHCIVLIDDRGLCGYLTIKEDGDVPDRQATHKVAPKVQLYSGDVNKLSYKGDVHWKDLVNMQ